MAEPTIKVDDIRKALNSYIHDFQVESTTGEEAPDPGWVG